MNAKLQSAVPRGVLIACLLLAYGCSKEQTPERAQAPTQPLVSADAVDQPVEVVLAGVRSTYSPQFQGEQLVGIKEVRWQTQQQRRSGEYQFYGGRLTRYSGAAPISGEPLELVFNVQGALQSGRLGERAEVPTEEIASIRSRAQLLRSHALAHRPDALHSSH